MLNKETRVATLGEAEGGLGWRRAGWLLPVQARDEEKEEEPGRGSRWHGRIRVKRHF